MLVYCLLLTPAQPSVAPDHLHQPSSPCHTWPLHLAIAPCYLHPETCTQPLRPVIVPCHNAIGTWPSHWPSAPCHLCPAVASAICAWTLRPTLPSAPGHLYLAIAPWPFAPGLPLAPATAPGFGRGFAPGPPFLPCHLHLALAGDLLRLWPGICAWPAICTPPFAPGFGREFAPSPPLAPCHSHLALAGDCTQPAIFTLTSAPGFGWGFAPSPSFAPCHWHLALAGNLRPACQLLPATCTCTLPGFGWDFAAACHLHPTTRTWLGPGIGAWVAALKCQLSSHSWALREEPQVIMPNLGVPSLNRRVTISLQVGCRDLASDTYTPHPRSKSTSCLSPFSMLAAILLFSLLAATILHASSLPSPHPNTER